MKTVKNKWHKFKKAVILKTRLLTGHSTRYPDFVIAGVQKGGTTSLYQYLIQHPQIDSALKKEIHYFDNNYQLGEKWYSAHFNKQQNNNLTGESSPYYMFHPEVPTRMAQLLPKVKIIMLLREPIARAHSHFQYMLKKGIEKEQSFDKAIQRELKFISDSSSLIPEVHPHQHQHFSYLSRGKYLEQINNWLKYYKKDQLLLLKSEDLFENPKEVLNQTYKFLGIDPYIPGDLSTKNKGEKKSNKLDTSLDLKAYFEPHNLQLRETFGNHLMWD